MIVHQEYVKIGDDMHALSAESRLCSRADVHPPVCFKMRKPARGSGVIKPHARTRQLVQQTIEDVKAGHL